MYITESLTYEGNILYLLLKQIRIWRYLGIIMFCLIFIKQVLQNFKGHITYMQENPFFGP